ncbi:MAG: hypothetical protein ILO34_01360 [Kiritimatiellae bacterium]|nr:hypothetical protein [Kiritimatiellia bacterium]
MIPVQEGYVLFTPTFTGISGNLDLASIEICDSEGNILDDVYSNVGIQKMDADGAYLEVYGYDYDTYRGWECGGSAVETGDVTFSVGESLSVNNDYGDTVYFRISGQVDLVNKNEVGEGYVLWGNSTPVAVDLTDIQVVDVEGNVLDDVYSNVGIQKMDDEGAYLEVYGFDYDTYGGWECGSVEVEAGDFVLQPGEAVCVANDYGDTVYFKLPSPL